VRYRDRIRWDPAVIASVASASYHILAGKSLVGTRTFLLALIFGSGCAYAAAATASNPLGFYAGGSAGRSDLRSNDASGLAPGVSFDANGTGWKAVVGLRPIPLIAAEFAYIDFSDHAAASSSSNFRTGRLDGATLQQTSMTLSGLLFAPISLPLLDLYARVGIARLETSVDEDFSCMGILGCESGIFPQNAFDRTNTDLLYGAGVQLKFYWTEPSSVGLAVRLEYERVNDSHGSPDLLSAGVLFRF
jgi:hypothetical protein